MHGCGGCVDDAYVRSLVVFVVLGMVMVTDGILLLFDTWAEPFVAGPLVAGPLEAFGMRGGDRFDVAIDDSGRTTFNWKSAS
jgi:hypothetical protein